LSYKNLLEHKRSKAVQTAELVKAMITKESRPIGRFTFEEGATLGLRKYLRIKEYGT